MVLLLVLPGLLWLQSIGGLVRLWAQLGASDHAVSHLQGDDIGLPHMVRNGGSMVAVGGKMWMRISPYNRATN